MFNGIDLFSDTVTKPTEAMRKAIANAEVGDEQKGEDPTTRKLEEMLADKLGFSAAMFFPSATMANEIAIRAHCEPGDELIAAEDCHLFLSEAGGPALHASVMARPIKTSNGIFTAEDIRLNYRGVQNPLHPVTKMVNVENITNMGGGIAWTYEQLSSVLNVAQELNLKTHLDGARFFNAVIASKLAPQKLAARFDTVTICLSKGLGCPIGAVLAFDKAHWSKIRRLKQLFGGAMRQSGMLAAAGIYALENHIERLQEDHDHARLLAEQLSCIPQIKVETTSPSTNMVFFSWHSDRITPTQFAESCVQKGLRFSQTSANRFRAVTHLDIKRADIEKTVEIVRKICSVD
jgi:threonine aldolase